MKRFSMVVTMVLLLFALSGCLERDFDSDAIVLRGAKNLNFSVGETKIVTAELPQVEGVNLTAISRDPALDAEISDGNTLTLSCDTAGEYILTLRLEAKGYHIKETRYPITVSIQTMQITAALQDGDTLDPSQGITLSMGDEKVLLLPGVPENAVYSIECTGPAVVSAEQKEEGIKLSPVAPGETTVQINVTCTGYQPYSLQLPVKVDKQAALLNLATKSVSGTTQDTLKVTCLAFQPGGHLSAKSDNPAVSAEIDGNIIRISSTKVGNFLVTVSCETEGYHVATQTVNAAFTMPPVPMTLPTSVTLALGQTNEVSVTGLPDGAKLSLTVSNSNITVQSSNNVISIEGKVVGNSSITVAASCEGYTDSRATLPVTISTTSYSSSSKYNSFAKEIVELVNQERTSRGLSSLVYLPELEGACQTRAKEASVVWDHTRPDGRSWKTILTDMGYAYHAAGENLLDANVLKPASAVEAWMDSEGHRENILRAEFTGTCVGIVQSSDGDYYYAQLFITKE
ncbi:MAG TPA: CAP domain-containing protein [Clostridia bacterium]|nr:CAP domain-containing protein [Clostridia bacterium]